MSKRLRQRSGAEWGFMGVLFGWTLRRWWASLDPAPADPGILTWTIWIACVAVPAIAVAWSFLPKHDRGH